MLAAVMLMTLAVQPAWAQRYDVKVSCEYYDSSADYYRIGTVGGTANASPNSGVSFGGEVTLTATPAAGYRFKEWDFGAYGSPTTIGFSPYDATSTFMMPNYSLSVVAKFTDCYDVSTTANPANGGTVQVSLDNAKWKGSLHAQVGQTVYFTLTPQSGYKATTYSVTSGGNPVATAGNSFTMPDGDVTVTGDFQEDNSGIASYSSITVNKTKQYMISGYLSTISDATNYASASPSSATQGTLVTLTARVVESGYVFDHWSVSKTSTSEEILYSTDATATFFMPVGNVDAMAYFKFGSVTSLSESDGFTSAVFAATDGQYADFSRAFTKGVASTVCLPFNYATSQASGKFYVFAGVDKTTDPWTVTMVNANKVSGMLTAGTPYMYVPSESPVTFGGTVKVSSASQTNAPDTDGGTWQFIGNYESKTWAAGDAELGTIYGFAAQPYEAPDNDGDGQPDYTVSPGEFVRAAAGANIAPFRAYLKYTAPAGARTRGVAQALPDRMTVRLVDDMPQGQATAIRERGIVNNGKATAVEAWHDLSGRRLTAKPAKKGVYVNNGRKVVIK